MRRALLAGTALALMLVASRPIQAAFGLDDDEIKDLVEEIVDGAMEAWLEDVSDLIFELGVLPADVVAQLREIFALIGSADYSYLPDGADFDPLYPDDMEDILTPVGAARHVERRDTARKARVEEAMAVAAQATAAMPANAIHLEALRFLNESPASVMAGIQFATEAGIATAKGIQQQIAVLAEIGQVIVDEHVQDDYGRRYAVEWACNHYGTEACAGAPTSFEPDTITLGW
jgi:hypothetical protein